MAGGYASATKEVSEDQSGAMLEVVCVSTQRHDK